MLAANGKQPRFAKPAVVLTGVSPQSKVTAGTGGGWRVGEQAGPERREGSPDAVPIRADDEFVADFHRVFGVS